MNLFDLLVEHLTAGRLEELEAINISILEAEDADQASARDFEFHRMLVDTAGNRTLSQTYGMLRPVIQRLMLAGKSQRDTLQTVVGEHAAILDALGRADRIGFSYHMDQHLSAGLKFIPEAPRSKLNAQDAKRRGRR